MELERLRIDRGGPARGAPGRGFPWLRLGLLLLLLAGLFLFREPLLAKLDEARLPAVRTTRAYRPDALAAVASSGTAANGYVVARKRAALSADTPGRIVELLVEEGTPVAKGDLVARLYPDEYAAQERAARAAVEAARESAAAAGARAGAARAALPDLEAQAAAAEARAAESASQVDAAAADVTLAEKEHTRAVRLQDDGVDTEERVDRALSDLDRARAALDAARAASKAAEADAAAARAALEHQRAEVAASDAAVTEAQALVPQREAELELASATLSKTELRAPFSGVIVLKDAEVGEVVSPNSQGASSRGSVATLVDFDSLEVQVELPETSIAKVRVGGAARIFLDAYADDPYTGHVTRIWPTANRQKATIEVRVSFDETDERLRPEMGARVVFAESAPPSGASAGEEPLAGVLVPESCVIRVEEHDRVFLVQGDRIAARDVELGRRRGGAVEVTAGLAEGDEVVLAPSSRLADGDRVRTTE